MARSVWAANLLFAAVTITLLTPVQSIVNNTGKLADKMLVGLHNLYHDDASLATSLS